MSYPQQPPWPHQPATPPSPKRRKLWPWVVGGVALVLVTIAATSGGEPAPTPAPSNATGQASAPTAAAPSGPATTVDDGTHEVGVDVEPGKYKTPGSSACYWARLKENDGSVGDIIDNGFSSGPQVTTLRKGEYFQSQGCETWAKVG
ncbi:MAG: hypothetical protein AB7I38_18805 [Dehalococcoidia bacterium]